MTWIFGYGSLMWRPGFSCREQRPALLEGYHRAFCRLSFRHRGTREQPGMVVGLAPGGACRGYALLPEPGSEPEVLAMLDKREGAGYERVILPLWTETSAGREKVAAHAYLPITTHPSHVPALTPERQVALIATGVGESGSAREYLRDLLTALAQLGVQEPGLEKMLEQVERFQPENQGRVLGGTRPGNF